MKYYLKEEFLNDVNQKNAGNKARNDVETVLNELGYIPLRVLVDDWYKMNVLKAQIHKYQALSKAFKLLKRGDEIVIQFPLLHHSLLFSNLLKSIRKKGIKTYFLIHDLETLRFVNDETLPFRMKLRMKVTEGSSLHYVNGIIAHNKVMKGVLVNKGVIGEKITNLEIFDYLIPDFIEKTSLRKEQPIIVAGNLSQDKAAYLYSLPIEPQFNLYGVGFDESRKLSNETYFGSFLPDELPSVLEGSFGLVWDGDSSETCSGFFGEYLRYNNSHKASLYLASGFPIIVWKESALSHFVLKNNCGIAVDSLFDIQETINNISEEEYQELVENAQKVGNNIRSGYYLKTALDKLIK